MTKSLSILAILSLMVFSQLSAQEIIEDKIEEVREVQLDSTQLIKIDGVAAVIGDLSSWIQILTNNLLNLRPVVFQLKRLQDANFLVNFLKINYTCTMQ